MTRENGTRAHQIGRRVFFLVLVGLLAPTGLMLWAGSRGYEELDRRMHAERALRARLVAERLSWIIGLEMGALLDVSEARGFDLEDGDPGPERAAVRAYSVRHRALFDEVFVVDGQGVVIAREGRRAGVLDGRALLAMATDAGPYVITGLENGRGKPYRLFALRPVRRGAGLLGLVGGRIDPAGERVRALLRETTLEEGASVDILDHHGAVVASTDPMRIGSAGENAAYLASLLADHRASAEECRGCRGAGEEHEVFAFHPLTVVRWGVNVRQDHDSAYAFARRLSRDVLLLAVFLFGIALLFAWGATRSVTRPVRQLRMAAERIGRGELDTPVPQLKADEVGRLGVSLEGMRESLRRLVSRVEEQNRVLEARVQERTAELERVNEALRERERARALALRKAISAHEDERRRIARELHDETSQTLAALGIALETAARASTEPGARKPLQEAETLVVRTIDEMHRIIRDLRPSVLDDLGLCSAIAWYAEHLLRSRGVAVRCEFSGLEERLPPEVETTLFRCAQEALTNIARHSEAETALVQCTRKPGRVTLEIEDDGKGFDLASAMTPATVGQGFGLLGLRERAELLGGELRADSAPGKGTYLVLDVPLA